MGGEDLNDIVNNGSTRESASNSKGTWPSGDASSFTQHWSKLSPSAPKSCTGAAAQLHPHSPAWHLGTKAPRLILSIRLEKTSTIIKFNS